MHCLFPNRRQSHPRGHGNVANRTRQEILSGNSATSQTETSCLYVRPQPSDGFSCRIWQSEIKNLPIQSKCRMQLSLSNERFKMTSDSLSQRRGMNEKSHFKVSLLGSFGEISRG